MFYSITSLHYSPSVPSNCLFYICVLLVKRGCELIDFRLKSLSPQYRCKSFYFILFIYFGKALTKKYADSDIFKGVIEPQEVGMYIIKCLLHSFQQHNL